MNTAFIVDEINTTLSQHLIQLAEQTDIAWAVAREALQHENLKGFFTDLLEHWCVCWMVRSLFYYSDTHTFFDTHYSEIEDLRVEFEETHGEPIPISGDLKNDLAWYAFREVAYRLLAEWELL